MTTNKLLNLTLYEKIRGVFICGNKQNGDYKQWYENNQLYIHCFYKNGRLHGEYKEWYSNGRLHRHCFYKDGKLDGECRVWSHDGKINTTVFIKKTE